MKKSIIILLVIAGILLILGIWQKNNIEAIYMYFTKDATEVSEILETNKKNLEEEISKYAEDIPRALTKEEEEKIASGEMSIEEAANMLLEEETEDESKPVAEDSKEPENEKEEKPQTDEKDDKKTKEGSIIKKYTAQFYSMKAYYMGQLSQIESKAKAEYAALSREEKKNLSKTAFISKYASYAMSLQSECDGKVESLLNEMKKELKAIGGDTKIITTIRDAYEAEKAARKAYYLSLVG